MMHRIHKVRFLLPLLSTVALLHATLCAQDTLLTYQGRVTSDGTNFTGVGQFKFALVTSVNANKTATATANEPSGGFVTGYTVTSGGSGYASPPTVSIFGGGGSGAVATAQISNGTVIHITVVSPGNGGYTSAPTVVIAPPPEDVSYDTTWSNDGTSVAGTEPGAAVIVGVSNGLFTVTLGDSSLPNMATLSASLFTKPNLQLRVWFNDGANGFAALNPAQKLTATPYADFANTAEKLNGTITSANVTGTYSGAVTLNNSNNSFTGNGAGLIGVNATTLNGIAASGLWSTTGNGGTTPGVNFAGTTDNQPMELHVNGLRALRLEPPPVAGGAPNVIGGSAQNVVDSGVEGAVIGGGGSPSNNQISANNSVIGGGAGNVIQSSGASYPSSTIGGGLANTIYFNNVTCAIGGGNLNVIQSGAHNGVIAGGLSNTNLQDSSYATIPGGFACVAGNFAFAAGTHAKATHQGSFVWADSLVKDFGSQSPNEFAARAQGGFRFVTGIDLSGNPTIGATLAQGATSWATISDKNRKKDVVAVDYQTILGTLSTVPIQQWHYTWESETNVPHLGPMAQDFKHAFYPGRDDKSITTLEFDGVELAAIQGLNQKLESQRAANAKLIQQNESLNQRLIALEAAVKALTLKNRGEDE